MKRKIMAASLEFFVGFPNIGAGEALTLLPALGTLFLLLGCLVQLRYEDLPQILLYYVVVGCCLLEACLFLSGNEGESILEERGSEGELGGVMEGTLWLGWAVGKKNLFSIKQRERKKGRKEMY